nr:unnamed protein product [Callosobruchus analis]
MARHLITLCIFCFICATHSPCSSHAAVRNENLLQQKEYEGLSDDLLVNDVQSAHWEREKRDLDHPNHVNHSHHRRSVDRKKLTRREIDRSNHTHPQLAKPNSDWEVQRRDLDHPNHVNHTHERHVVKRNSDISSSVNSVNSENEYVKKIFTMYGNGEVMTIQGFEKLVDHLKIQGALKQEVDTKKLHSTDEILKDLNNTKNMSQMCMNKDSITALIRSETERTSINGSQFYKACPVLLYSIIAEDCAELEHLEDEESEAASPSSGLVWLCSITAIVIISACGVLSLAIIPVMQKKFYKPLIQFLVALAVGTLAGDALLHLLPHAMTPSHHHGHGLEVADHSHDENTQKGCIAMLGLTFFFIMERLIQLFAKWRKGKTKQRHSHVTVIKDRRESMNHKNNMQCVDKYNPIPFCYKDIMSNPHTIYDSDKTATTIMDPSSNNSDMCKKLSSGNCEQLDSNRECATDLNMTTESNKMLTPEHKHEHDDYTVILREHRNEHHGHSHKHGHVHAAPKDLSSVAWMVIMGDGLHNFTDGMAIGAAFSGGLAGGFSTTVAVFCHELPHELGDFAMLLKAGMTIKQALFYNILSSVLCIFGNIAGLALGNMEYASSWVFAAAAGMFIYIALVDMIPELSSAHEDEGNLLQCVLHLGGLLLGFGIMALIALYEHDLKSMFNEH